jgi:hypothetical protein
MATTQQQIAERQQGFFSVLTEAQTYRNLLFFFLIVPLALLHAGLIALVAFVILSIAAYAMGLPTPLNLVGLTLIVPAFGFGLLVIAWLLDTQTWFNHRLLGVDRPVSPRASFSVQSCYAWCRERFRDRWTWSGLLYLLVITFLGAVAALSTLLFIAISVSLFAGSVSGDLGSVQIAIGSLDLQIPGLRIFMLPLAPMVAIVGLHLANVLAGFAARVGYVLLGPRPSRRPAHTSLSSAAETAYAAPRGERVTARDRW